MGRAAKKSIISKTFHLFLGIILAGCLLACVGKDGGLNALGGGTSGDGGFAGGALDAGGGDNPDQIVQNQADPLSAGNADATMDYSDIFITMSCSQSLCYSNPQIEGLSDQESNQCHYLVKGHVENNFVTKAIGQVIDRDQNKFRYFKINNFANFEFPIWLDDHPHVELYATKFDYSTTPVSDVWTTCGADDCPPPEAELMHPKFFDISCDFLKSKPEPQIQIMKAPANSAIIQLQKP